MRTLFFLFVSFVISTAATAQTWNTTGNAGTVPGTNYIGTTDAKDLVFKTNGIEKGRVKSNGLWQFGAGGNLAKIDSAGNLSFAGNSAYKVAGNKYAFQYAGNPNYGLFFNSTNLLYEFRTSTALSVFSIGANTGNGIFKGNLKVGAYTLPATDGTTGQVLKTNGAGALTWSADNGTSYTAGTGMSIAGSTINSSWTLNGADVYNNNSGSVGIGTTNPNQYYNLTVGTNSGTRDGILVLDPIERNILYCNKTGSGTGIYVTKYTSFSTSSVIEGHVDSYNNAIEGYHTNGNFGALGGLYAGVTATGSGNSNGLSANATGTGNAINAYAVSTTALYASTNSSLGNPTIVLDESEDDAARIYFQNTTPGRYWSIEGYNNSTFSNARLNFINSVGGTILSLTGDRNVGIGTTTPSARLDVEGDVAGPYYNLYSKVNSTAASSDNIAIYAESQPYPGWGYGIDAYAGFKGVSANVEDGAYGLGYGVSGFCHGTTGTQIGIYGSASGGTSNWGVYSAGITYSVGAYQSSDAKLKKDVQPIENALDKIEQLKAHTYTFKTDEYKYMGLPTEQQYGFIAQELEQVFPEMVKDVEQPIDNDYKKNGSLQFKAINYIELIPVLTQAIQEQQKTIDEQNQQIADLNAKQDVMMNKMNSFENALSQCCSNYQSSSTQNGTTIPQTETALLEQNVPNPFMQNCYIKFYIPSTAKNSYITISDLNGKEIRIFNNLSSGFGTVNISGGELVSGEYNYTLIIDGNKIDSKKMTLTK